MADLFEIKAQPRAQFGKTASRRLRRENRVPAIIYGAGKDPEAIVLEQDAISHMLENEATYSHILKVKLDNNTQQVVLKALKRHPFKPKIEHVDFLRIRATEKLFMKVPLHFVGGDVCPGVKKGDGENLGVVSQMASDLEIKCLPANLPEFIEVDISHLELNQTLHLSDIKLPAGVELAAGEIDEEHDRPIITVHVPRAEIIREEPVAMEAEGEEKVKTEETESTKENKES